MCECVGESREEGGRHLREWVYRGVYVRGVMMGYM